jgi:glutathione S-transferase
MLTLSILVRFFLNYLNIPFEDKRYTDENEWYAKDKIAFNTKLANLPYLTIGADTTFESDAVYYAAAIHANRLDLFGKDNVAIIRVA